MNDEAKVNPSRKGVILRFGISIIAILGIVFVLRDKIGDAFFILKNDVKWSWFFVAIITNFGALAFLAIRLKLVLKVQDITMSFKETYYLGFVGLFYNLFFPSAVGGDIAKAYYASKHSGKKIEATTAIIIDRLLGFVALISMALVALLYFQKEIHDRYIDYCVYGAMGVVLFSVLFFASRRFARTFGWLKYLIPMKKWREKLSEVYHAIYGYRKHPGVLLSAVFLAFSGQVLFVIMHYWIVRSLGVDISVWTFFVLVPVVAIVSMAPSINGLGVREAGVIYLFSSYMSPERALAMSILLDLLIYGFSIGAGIVYAFRGGLKKKIIHDMEMMKSA